MVIKKLTIIFIIFLTLIFPNFSYAEPRTEYVQNVNFKLLIAKTAIVDKYKPLTITLIRYCQDSNSGGNNYISGCPSSNNFRYNIPITGGNSDYTIYSRNINREGGQYTSIPTSGWQLFVESTTKDNEGTNVYWSVGLSLPNGDVNVTLKSNGDFEGATIYPGSQSNNAGNTTAPGTVGPGADPVDPGAGGGGTDPGTTRQTDPLEGETGEDKDWEPLKILGLCDDPSSNVYTAGILKGVSCTAPLKTLDEVLTVIKNVLNFILLPSAGVIFLIMMIIGGILYVSSAGNQNRIDSAKKTLTAGVIGLIIVMGSYTIIRIAIAIMGGGVSGA